MAAVPWLLVGVLLVSNAAMLLSERVQQAGYEVIEAVAGVAGSAAVDAMLARSPRARTNALEDETRTLKERNVQLVKSNETLRTTTLKRAAAVKSMTTRINTKLAVRSAQGLATLPMRAVPYAGIPVLLAFTALELKADCDFARSLAELTAEHGNESLDTGAVCAFVDEVPTADQTWKSVKAHASATVNGAYAAIGRVALRCPSVASASIE